MGTAIQVSKRGAAGSKYRLRLTSLKFLSAVDTPAQETATARLLKRGPDGSFAIRNVAPVAKLDEKLGLVFGWAWTGKVDGEDYFDLHGDAIVDDDEMIKVAADFMSGARLTDAMHDRNPDGSTVFGMPMTPEIAKAYGIETTTTGFMVALRPSPETFAKFVSGEYTGFSLDGMGIREEVAAAKGADAVAKRAALTDDVDGHSHTYDLDVQNGTTSGGYMRAEGSSSESYHYHPYVIADGVVEIGAAAGHTHAPRAAAVKAAPAPTAPTTKDQAMTTDADRIKHLEAELAKSQAEIVKLKAPPAKEVYKAADGSVFTEADDERLVAAVKRADSQAAELAGERLTKRAIGLIKSLPGTDAVKAAIVGALDTIADKATRDLAFAALDAGDKAHSKAFVEIGGAGGDPVEGSAQAEVAKRIEKRMADAKETKDVATEWLVQNDNSFNALRQKAKAEKRLDRVARPVA